MGDITDIFNMTGKCFAILNTEVSSNVNGNILMTVLSLSFILIIISNLLMIIGLRQTNKKLSLSKQLFIILCIVDLLTGFLTVPFQITMINIGSKSNCMLIAMQAFFNCFTPSLSIWLLFMISVTRYGIILQKHSRFKRLFSPKFIKRMLVFEVIFSLIFSAAYVYISQSTNKELHAFFLLFVSLFCILLIFPSFIINIRLLVYFKRKSNKADTILKDRRVNVRKYHEQVTTTLLILSVFLIILYTPMTIAFGVIGYLLLISKDVVLYYHYFIPWTHAVIVLNSFLNSFVYVLRSKVIKRFYRRKFFPRSGDLNQTESLVDLSFYKNKTVVHHTAQL